MRTFIDSVLKQIKEFFAKLSKKDKIRIFVLALVVVVLAIAVTIILGHTNYVELYPSLDPAEAGEIMSILKERGGVSYKTQGGKLLVPENMADELRMELSFEGLPTGTDDDLSLLQSGGIGQTDQQFRTMQTYQRQKEMKAAIMMFSMIEECRVTLNPQERSSFVMSANNADARVSVQLKVKNDARLTKTEVFAIAQSIKDSVQGLKMENITIVDTNANYYSLDETETIDEVVSVQFALEEQVRARLEDEVVRFLEPVFGINNVRALARVTLNFDDEVSEKIVIEPPVPGETEGLAVSMYRLRENSLLDEPAEGVPGTDTNGMGATEYPYEDGAADGDLYRAIDEINYEFNKLTTQIEKAKGTIKSLNISVIINSDAVAESFSGDIRSLVANAAGVKEDYISVMMSEPFFKEEIGEDPVEKYVETIARKEIIENIIMWIVILALGIAVILLIRSIFKGLAPQPEPQIAMAGAGIGELDFLIGGEDEDEFEYEYEEMDVEVEDLTERDEQQFEELELSSKISGVEQLEKFIEKDPKAVAQLLRNWLTDD